MKQEKLIYTLLSIVAIAGAIMKILHYRYGNLVFIAALFAGIVFQNRHIAVLKKRIEELERTLEA